MGMHENLGVFQDAAVEMTATGYSTNFIDMAAIKPALGVGTHAPMLCIRMATTSDTAADTLSIEVRMSDTVDQDATGGVLNGTITTVFMPFCGPPGTAAGEIRADHARSATGKFLWRGPLPYEVNQRYVQLYFNNSAATGHYHIDAWLEDGAQSDFRGSQVLTSPVGNP